MVLKRMMNASTVVRKTLSAYEVKNNCFLFEKLFLLKKNGVSFLEYLFSFWRYSRFCIMQMRKVMTS